MYMATALKKTGYRHRFRYDQTMIVTCESSSKVFRKEAPVEGKRTAIAVLYFEGVVVWMYVGFSNHWRYRLDRQNNTIACGGAWINKDKAPT